MRDFDLIWVGYGGWIVSSDISTNHDAVIRLIRLEVASMAKIRLVAARDGRGIFPAAGRCAAYCAAPTTFLNAATPSHCFPYADANAAEGSFPAASALKNFGNPSSGSFSVSVRTQRSELP